MKKQQRNLLAAAAVLVVAGGAYALLAAQGEEETAQTLDALTGMTVSEVSYTNSEGTWSFSMGEDGLWYYTEDESCPIVSDRVDSMVSTMQELTADRTLEEHDDLSVYGLDAPDYTVVLGDGEQEVTILTSQQDAAHYFYIEGQDAIYTTSDILPTALDNGLMDWVDYPTLPYITGDKMTKITLNGITLERLETETTEETTDNSADTADSADAAEAADTGETSADSADAADAADTGETTADSADAADAADTGETSADAEETEEETARWKITYADGTTVEREQDETIESLLSAIGLLYQTGCADYNVTDDRLAQYGLDAPRGDLAVTYETDEGTDSLTLKIGTPTADGTGYYGMLNEDGFVTILDYDSTQTLLDLNLSAE